MNYLIQWKHLSMNQSFIKRGSPYILLVHQFAVSFLSKITVMVSFTLKDRPKFLSVICYSPWQSSSSLTILVSLLYPFCLAKYYSNVFIKFTTSSVNLKFLMWLLPEVMINILLQTCSNKACNLLRSISWNKFKKT